AGFLEDVQTVFLRKDDDCLRTCRLIRLDDGLLADRFYIHFHRLENMESYRHYKSGADPLYVKLGAFPDIEMEKNRNFHNETDRNSRMACRTGCHRIRCMDESTFLSHCHQDI